MNGYSVYVDERFLNNGFCMVQKKYLAVLKMITPLFKKKHFFQGKYAQIPLVQVQDGGYC